MGSQRNGARSFLDLLQKLCKLSRLPGFQGGLNLIMGAETGAQITALWEPLCALVDTLVAADNFYNQFDRQGDDGAGEDVNVGPPA